MFVEAEGALQAGVYVEDVQRGCLDVVEDPWEAQTKASRRESSTAIRDLRAFTCKWILRSYGASGQAIVCKRRKATYATSHSS